MASDTAYSPSPPAPPPAENYRKRRRNRTRVSCLNCYASKRKCDRKRPCTRCINHGLTGLCFYELDDPAARDDDETARLRRRIAELESVVRALNNRPHPRWTAPGGVVHRPTTRRAASSDVDAFFADAAVKPDPDAAPALELDPDLAAVKREPAPELELEFDPEPAATTVDSPFGSPLTPLLSDLCAPSPPPSRAEAAMQTSPPPSPPPCDCLVTATLHSPLLYFASALRASREALEGSHAPGSACVLLQRITELDEHIFSVPPPDLYFAPPPSPPPPPPPPAPPLQLSDVFAFFESDLAPGCDWT